MNITQLKRMAMQVVLTGGILGGSAAVSLGQAVPSKLQQPTAEGTWIADGGAAPVAQPVPDAQYNPSYAGENQGDEGYGGCGCDDGGCDGEGRCGCGGLFGCWPAGDLWNQTHSHRRYYGGVDYLYMRSKGTRLPALVTTSPNGTVQADAGVLGLGTTTVLYGNQKVNNEYENGIRANFGMWLVDGEFLGIEGNYLRMEDASNSYSAVGTFRNNAINNNVILARPFSDTFTGNPNSVLLAFPNFNPTGDLDGSINVKSTTQVESAGTLLRRLLWIDFDENYRVDFLLGYRWFKLNDSVIINDTTTFDVVGTHTLTSQDNFFGSNQFHGIDFGFSTQIFRGRLSSDFITKVALGNNRELVSIFGSTQLDGVNASLGGLLTQPTNIGQTRRDMFAALPEATLKLRFDVTSNLRVTGGYSFLWLSNAVRAASQIDTQLDSRQIQNLSTVPSATAPARVVQDTTYYLHGITAGVEYNF